MKQEILDILVGERLETLEDIAGNDEEYQAVRKEQLEAFKRLEEMGLSSEQREAVDDILSKVNRSGAVYGKIAFKQGLKDGAKLMAELKGIIWS
ncbi:MAG: hypothetical protein NC307_14495 [Roseburia sp.]|nr:hypothetical protein [Roseburia sp.]